MSKNMLSHVENTSSEHSEDFEKSNNVTDLAPIRTIDIENYHGLTAKTILVYAALNLIAFAQLMNLVGAAAFSRNVGAAVGGATKTVWLSQCIAIMTVVLGPIVSQAADFWGRKWFLVILTAFAAIGSIVVARTTSIGMAIAGEAIAGLAYGSQPLYYAVVSEILPRRWRPAAQGGINASLGAGGLVAILAGEAMVRNYHEGFRLFWYFATALPAVAALICAIFYNPPLRPLQKSLTLKEKLGRLDWVAYALLACGIVLFSVALSWSDNPYPWTSAEVLAPFFIGLAFLVGLVVHQVFFKYDGLFHHDMFKKDRNFAIALGIVAVDGMVFFGANNYFAFEMSVLFETDPVRVGLRFAMVFFSSVFSSLGIALYSTVRKSVRGPIILSFLLIMIFFIGMATATIHSSTAVWIYPVIFGLGVGISLTCLVTVAQMSAPPALIAISSGLMIASRSFGGSIALAIYTAEFSSEIAKNLPADIAAAVLPLGLSPKALPELIGALTTNNEKLLMTIPGITPQVIGAAVEGLKMAYLSAFRPVWITGGALSLAAAIAGFFIIEPSHDFNMHVDAPLDED